MFGWLKKNPVESLKRDYNKLLVEARDLQRYGDIVAYSAKIAESEEILKQIDELESLEASS